jgi:tungstate transport system ATP-binding protein
MSMRAPASDLPISFDQVSLTAGGVRILDAVTLEFTPGRPTILVGPNGSGKSTLLRIAMGLARPTGGRLTWGGRTETDGRRRAIVFQRPVMLRRSAAENIGYALAASGVPRKARPGCIADLLDEVGLAHVAARPARRLSGGEQQRLALARALARSPEVLLLDEPTASLDPAATKAVEDIVRAIAGRGVKIIMATHDLGQARRLGSDIVFLVRGRVCEQAPAERFFTSPATREAAAFVHGDLVF